MSVRRLAEPAVQPASFAFTGGRVAEVQRWIAKYPQGRQQSAIIPLLMLAQEQEGWVTKAALEHVADMLDMPYIRALEVATFYTQFQLKPVGTRAHVQVCGTTPCMLRGAGELIEVCRSKIHSEQFHTNADGTLSWEEVECLGACVNAPMVMIFKDTYEDLTPERLAEIIDAFEAGEGASVPVGPQNGRMASSPQDGLTSLRDEAAILQFARERNSRASEAAAGASVPPSNAGKPKTHAEETGDAQKSPSAVKVDVRAESKASVKAPGHDARAANKVEPQVEASDKQRRGKSAETGPAALKSPELLRGEPIGPAGKRRRSEPVAPVGEPSPDGRLAAGAGAAGKSARPSLDDPKRPAGTERPAQPDDLQLISGVGPKTEAILHSLGIYTFAQVASWTPEQRSWVDGYLNFRGRIDRENWTGQAEALARGGVDEYVRVFGRKPV